MSDSVASWVAVHSVPGMGHVTFRRLLSRFGTMERVLEHSDDGTLDDVLRLEPSLRQGVLRAKARMEWATRTLETLSEHAVRVVRSVDSDYPQALRDLPDGPPLLYQFGEWRAEDIRSVGIVGSTRPSGRGRDISRGLGMRLARAGITVVSGFALGVDDAAHLGALGEGGRTVICLPCGVRRFQPRAEWPSMRELSERAVVLSERPPDADWETHAALSRNRLIAALSRALIVAETSPKGGAMNTLEHAQRLGRCTFAVKFRNAPQSGRGNAIALAKGAQPLQSLGDVDRVAAALDTG